MSSLNRRVASITGGAGVLCSTIAVGLARADIQVVLLDIAEEKANEALVKVKNAEGEGLALKANVLSRADLEMEHSRSFPRLAGRYPDKWGGRQSPKGNDQSRTTVI